MARTVYDKLVRDRIPEIIRRHGARCGIETFADDEPFRRALRAKLVEEAQEALEASDADLATELADLLEVVDALIEAYGLKPDALHSLQAERRAERGGFAERLHLLWTE
jgi:predicted house-cleaning noncanonical NTP pyrophosphatase (MazG superfamily)